MLYCKKYDIKACFFIEISWYLYILAVTADISHSLSRLRFRLIDSNGELAVQCFVVSPIASPYHRSNHSHALSTLLERNVKRYYFYKARLINSNYFFWNCSCWAQHEPPWPLPSAQVLILIIFRSWLAGGARKSVELVVTRWVLTREM